MCRAQKKNTRQINKSTTSIYYTRALGEGREMQEGAELPPITKLCKFILTDFLESRADSSLILLFYRCLQNRITNPDAQGYQR